MKDGTIQMLCKKHLVILGIFITLLMIVCTGCGNKSSITTTDFISTMESNNYYIKDVIDQYAGYEVFSEATLAINPTNEYQIEFYTFVNEDGAKDSYNVTKHNQFEPYEDSSSSKVSAEVGNYAKYAITSSGKYMYICRIDNTMIYANVPETYKDEVKNIIDKLGY